MSIKVPLALWLGILALPVFADSAAELVAAARARTQVVVTYDGAYRAMDYPMGDVADNRGVCTDVVIRSYRGLGVDLQQKVHEDMRHNFDQYPKLWGLSRPDSNIDHRRVPNLQTFFRRHGQSFPVPIASESLKPGDLVTWMLPGNLPHIGVVSDRFSDDGKRPLIIHNIGRGPQEEDALKVAPVTGHFRYYPTELSDPG